VLQFPKQLNRDRFDQIRLGMSQAEVEAILGGPPGDYGRYRWGTAMMTCEGSPQPPGSVEVAWFDDSSRFEVFFNRQGRVVGSHRRAGFERLPPAWVRHLLSFCRL
jgi:hypothetical protein